jgi:uncharacterized membrane protein YdbT with pleckstrin-like domain
MSYIENNLIDSEKLIYRSYLHPIIFLQPIFLAIFLYVIYQYIPYQMFSAFLSYQIFIAIPFVLVFISFAMRYILYISTEFGVTNKRIIVKRGWIAYNTSENFLQKVEDIQVSQSVLGRILNYGTIIIYGTGGTAERFPLIANPLTFRKYVQEEVSKVIDKD